MNALDLGLFINGLPIATFELKNSLTKQTVEDAVEQYKRDRDPKELLFQFGRCVAHFAVDDSEVRFCTQLKGKALLVPALQQGVERRRRQSAESGRDEDRLPLEEMLTPKQPRRTSSKTTPRSSRRRTRRRAGRSASRSFRAITNSTSCASFWPTPAIHGAGKRYLIEHSAGSGKSNSIAWLAHQLIGLKRRDKPMFRVGHRGDGPQDPRQPAA